MKKRTNFHFTYMTDDDIKRENITQINNLTEDKLSEIIFNGESFYILGKGHSFCYGFFTKYITKSGIIGFDYGRFWVIDGVLFDYENYQFVKKREVLIRNPNMSDFSSLLSQSKIYVGKSISEDLVSVKAIVHNI